jgi:hypothetical protein
VLWKPRFSMSKSSFITEFTVLGRATQSCRAVD